MRSSALLPGLLLALGACPADDTSADTNDGSTTAATSGTAESSTGASVGSSSTTGVPETSTGADDSSTGEPLPLDYEPVLLDCTPGSTFPFTTEGSGFENPEAEMVASENPRLKDVGSDLLGNPGGPYAYTTQGNADAVGSATAYEGEKARTANDTGLDRTGLAGEAVSLWRYDGADWAQADRQNTAEDGSYNFSDAAPSNNNEQPLYAVLEADQSCAPHYTWLLEPGTPFILADIDGTLTLSDDELFMQVSDGAYDPLQKGAAVELMQTWAAKGYTIVYMTARPHVLRNETRAWLDTHDYPAGPVISSGSLAVGSSAVEYKSAWGLRLISEFGWAPVAFYGNADTDIAAYEAAGVPKDITFIIGELAGTEGTVAIEDDDYSAHIAAFVTPYPDAP